MVLLHGMTHTSAGGYREVVKVSVGGPLGIIRRIAYGWEKQKRLAKKVPYGDREAKRACDEDADTLACFALGCKMMSDQNNPRLITDDGVVKPIDRPMNWSPNSWNLR